MLVKTSDVRGAGTDANIFITLYGPKGDSGERQIETGANNFERNQLDTFIIKVSVDMPTATHNIVLFVLSQRKLSSYVHAVSGRCVCVCVCSCVP